MQKKSKTIPSNGLFELPIDIDFAPKDTFTNLN